MADSAPLQVAGAGSHWHSQLSAWRTEHADAPFEDASFAAAAASIGDAALAESAASWRRPSSISAAPRLFNEKETASAISQGALDDCCACGPAAAGRPTRSLVLYVFR